MKKYFFPVFALVISITSAYLLLGQANALATLLDNQAAADQESTVLNEADDMGRIIEVSMETSMGEVMLEVYPDKAPETVKNFLNYINTGAYDGVIFHRIIKGFMNQGGGYTTEYEKTKTQAAIANEAYNGLKNLRGTIAMARTNAPHSATKQFFINTANNNMLNHTGKNMRGWGYAVFGKVTKGMDVMDNMANVATGAGGPFAQDAPKKQIIILKMSEIKTEMKATDTEASTTK